MSAAAHKEVATFLSWYFRSLFDFPQRRPYPSDDNTRSEVAR